MQVERSNHASMSTKVQRTSLWLVLALRPASRTINEMDKSIVNHLSHIEITTEFEQALSLCQDLYIDEAESQLDHIIRNSPGFIKAYTALALVKLLQGQLDQHRFWLEQALQISPGHFQALHQLSISRLLNGDPQNALTLIKEALNRKPSEVSTVLLAAQAYLKLGQYSNAIDQADRALILSRGWHPEAHLIKSQAMLATLNGKTSFDIFTDLISGDEDTVKLTILCQLIDEEASHEGYLNKVSDAIAEYPDRKLLFMLRVCILRMLGRPDDCFRDLYYLLSINQDEPRVLIHFAEIFQSLNRFQESLQVYLRIIRLTGPSADLYSQVGVCYRGLGLWHSAQKAMRRAVRANPLSWAAIGNLGEICFRLGDHTRARSLYKISLRLNPICDTSFFNLMLAYSIGEASDMQEMLGIARNYWDKRKHIMGISTARSTNDEIILQDNSSQHTACLENRSGEKIRICILTSDVGNHCVSYFLASFLRHYSKEVLCVELALCSRRYEERELAICDYADDVLCLEGRGELEARSMLLSRNYDIIIECNGYTGESGLAILAHRCAPIQCHYIGYHASTGLDSIDYFISDSYILNKNVQLQLSEKSAALDRAWLAFNLFETPPIAQAAATADRPILGFFGNSTKITDETLAYWREILGVAGDSILVLKDLTFNDPRIATKTLDRLSEKGIEKDRVALLAPTNTWAKHMECYNLIDYALDSTPWSSATTGFDAIAMGVPLLAIEGNTIASRMSSSLVHHLGYSDWISRTPSDYAKLGDWIQSDFHMARKNKSSLQEQSLSSSLFDGKDLSKSLERLLLRIHSNHSQLPS